MLYKATQVDLSARGSYCLVVSQAKHCGEFRMPKCRCPRSQSNLYGIGRIHSVFTDIQTPRSGWKNEAQPPEFL